MIETLRFVECVTRVWVSHNLVFSNVKDIIVDIDEEWVKKIQMQKFQWHNSEWLSSMQERHDHDGFEESAVIYANRKGVESAGHGARDDYYDDEDSDEEERMFQQMLKNQL